MDHFVLYSVYFSENTLVPRALECQDNWSMALNQFTELDMIPENDETGCHTQRRIERRLLWYWKSTKDKSQKMPVLLQGPIIFCASLKLFGYVILKLIDVINPVSSEGV